MTVIHKPPSGYGWLDTWEAYCFTAVVGLDIEEVIRRLGADPYGRARRNFDECFWTVNDPQWALVGHVAGGVLIAEHNGWRAEEALAQLSTRGRAASFYRNVHAVMQFSYAQAGSVLAQFDPLLQTRPITGAAPRVLDSLLAGLRFGLFTAEASALTLLERATGIRVAHSWLAHPQWAIELPPLD